MAEVATKPAVDNEEATPELIELLAQEQRGEVEISREAPTTATPELEQLIGEETQEPEGFFGQAKELITGDFRTTPELEELRSLGDLPELNEMSMARLKSSFGALTGSPKETVQVLQSNFPSLQFRRDSKGNYIVKSGESGEEFSINKPGFDKEDLKKGAFVAALFGPAVAATGGGIIPAMGAAAAVQTGIEAAQAASGGDFDLEQIPLAAATETIPFAGGGLARAGKGALRGVGRAVSKIPGVKQVARRVLGEGAEGAGTGAVRAAAKAPLSEAEQVVRATEKAGITPLTSDIIQPKTNIGKVSQRITERVPFAGTGPVRAAQQVQRTEAVKGLLRDFGADDTARLASKEVMEDLASKRGAELKKYSKLKKDVISKLSDRGDVPTPKAIKTIDKELDNLKGISEERYTPLLKVFNDFKRDVKDQNLNGIEELRDDLGDLLTTDSLVSVKQRGEKIARKIYGSLREDMGDFIKKTGDKRDFTKWKVGNKRLADMQGEIDINILKSVLKTGKATPENISKILFSKKPSELRLLRKNLTPEGRSSAKVAVFQQVIEDMKGIKGIEDITPEKFLTQMNKRKNQVDIFLNKEDKQLTYGLMKALDVTKRAGEAGVAPDTGGQLLPFVTPALAGAAGAATGGGVSGSIGAATLAAVFTGSIGVAGRIFESKQVRNLLLQLAKAPKGQEAVILKKLTPLLQSFRQQE